MPDLAPLPSPHTADIARRRLRRLLPSSAVLLGLAAVVGLAAPFPGHSASPPAPAAPAGSWLAEDIGGRGVIDSTRSTLELEPDGAVSGFGACNRYRGKATVSGNAIRFGPMASTRMACPPAVMAQEQAFLAALDGARSWRADPARGRLQLLDGSGAVLATLAAY